MFVLSVFLSLDVFWCFVLFGLVLFCVFLQCFGTVGWVIWPVKPVPDMTYNVFGGTLSLTQSVSYTATHFNSEFWPEVTSWAAAESIHFSDLQRFVYLLFSRCSHGVGYCSCTITWSSIYLHATHCSGYRWVSGWQHISYDLAFSGIIILCYFYFFCRYRRRQRWRID